jgi:hypothetical protein
MESRRDAKNNVLEKERFIENMKLEMGKKAGQIKNISSSQISKLREQLTVYLSCMCSCVLEYDKNIRTQLDFSISRFKFSN